MLMLSNYLIFSVLLFSIGLTGIFINRKSLITLLMCIEIVLLAVNTNFIIFSFFINDLTGQIVVFFVLTIAAVEASIGLAILIVLFRQKNTIKIEDINLLKG